MHLWQFSATQLAQRIAGREVSSREVVQAHIARIEAANPQLNALVVPLFDQAIAAAKEADERQARGETLGPLHGLPLSIKECFHIAGTPSTMGIGSLAKQMQTSDGPLVAQLKNAGGIVLGKTNVPQLMLMHETDNPVYGRTNNPWNVDRTPGGSSGGEASLIAAGGSPCGLGSDLGGSIRVPAHFCGLAGFKPSSRRLTKRGSVPNLRGLEALQWQPGPLARRVDDLELLLRVLVDENSTDPEVLPAPLRECRREVRGLRIAFWDDNGFFPYAPAVKRAVREAVAALSEQGAIIEELTPPKISEAMFLFTALMAADGAADSERLVRGSKVDPRMTQYLLAGRIPNRLRGLVAWFYQKSGALHKAGLIRAARSRSADEVWQLTKHLYEYRQKFLDSFAAKYDALVLPVYALPAPKHGQVFDLVPAVSDTIFINLLGVPSGCVPVTTVRPGEETARPASRELAASIARAAEQDSAGMPIGVQVVSHFWREEIVLDVMRAIEAGCDGSRAPVVEIAGSPAP